MDLTQPSTLSMQDQSANCGHSSWCFPTVNSRCIEGQFCFISAVIIFMDYSLDGRLYFVTDGISAKFCIMVLAEKPGSPG